MYVPLMILRLSEIWEKAKICWCLIWSVLENWGTVTKWQVCPIRLLPWKYLSGAVQHIKWVQSLLHVLQKNTFSFKFSSYSKSRSLLIDATDPSVSYSVHLQKHPFVTRKSRDSYFRGMVYKFLSLPQSNNQTCPLSTAPSAQGKWFGNIVYELLGWQL